ncbi:hypothetical protein DFH08DRAFT_809121 [Mycena albidolilacea]|uniref:Uncharacterized protein n=1 Tax=Mycena albidolilacea TaxID=1033008 RepID=A0AAD7ES39_9AGAR|nr:hypothetical protein DFH08DRAFT_809121 [Mycena albidolilacea]
MAGLTEVMQAGMNYLCIQGISLGSIGVDIALPPAHGKRKILDLKRQKPLGRFSVLCAKRLTLLDRKSPHCCPGYVREDITLATTTHDGTVIAHNTPSPLEICSICHEVVKHHGKFRCICASSLVASGARGYHTIKCQMCKTWSYSACVGNPEWFISSVSFLAPRTYTCKQPQEGTQVFFWDCIAQVVNATVKSVVTASDMGLVGSTTCIDYIGEATSGVTNEIHENSKNKPGSNGGLSSIARCVMVGLEHLFRVAGCQIPEFWFNPVKIINRYSSKS